MNSAAVTPMSCDNINFVNMSANSRDASGPERILQFKEMFSLQSFVQKQLSADNAHVTDAHVVGQEADGSVLVSWDSSSGGGGGGGEGGVGNSSPVVTKVGLYSLVHGRPSYRELYRHNERVYICSATVNAPHLSLLAFTTVEEEREVGGEPSYVSYCAEIQPQGRSFVIELSCDCFCFRKLQYLTSQDPAASKPTPSSSFTPSTPSSSSHRQSRYVHSVSQQHQGSTYASKLLVVVPSAFITTYTTHLQQTYAPPPSPSSSSSSPPISCVGITILDFNEDSPRITPHSFDWYQWDPRQQWLYYARIQPKPDMLVLSCVAFGSHPYEQVLSLCLPLPYPCNHYKVGGGGGGVGGASCTPPPPPPPPSGLGPIGVVGGSAMVPQVDLTTPSHQLNVQVIYRRKENHLLCVCVQHRPYPFPSHHSDNSDGSSVDNDYTPRMEDVLEYSVYMIHNGHVLHGLVPFSALPAAANLRVHFMHVGKFVAVYVPGVMLHLLNVHPQVDPCHHLVLDANLSPPLPIVVGGAPDANASAPVRTTPSWTPPPVLCNVMSMATNIDSTGVMDSSSQVIYECCLCPGAFLDLFKGATGVAQQVDLLHLAIVTLRLQNLALSMVEHICHIPVTLDTHQVFAEFILAYAYNNTLVSHAQRYVTSQLPLTTTWPSFNGGVYRNECGATYAQLKIAPIEEGFAKRLLVMVQVTQNKMESPDDLMACRFFSEGGGVGGGGGGGEAVQDVLYFNVVTTQPRLQRVKISTLLDRQAEAVGKGEFGAGGGGAGLTGSTSKRLGPFRKFLRGVIQGVTNQKSIKLDSSVSLPFLDPEPEVEPLIMSAMQNLKEVLTGAIGGSLNSSARALVSEQLESFYVPEVQRESCELLKVIWQSLGLGRDNHPLNNTLYRQATPLEHILFELLEAYLHAHLDLGIPVPSGFHKLYACLGFLCLEPVVFLQYFAHGAFQVTRNFVDKAIQCSNDAQTQLGGSPEVVRQDELLYCIICDLPEADRVAAFERWQNPEVKLMLRPSPDEGR